MFKNIGKKIKGFVTFLCIFGFVVVGISAIAGLITGIVTMARGNVALGIGILFGSIFAAAIGCVFVWISCFIFYGYGELVDKTADIAKNTELTAQKVTKLEYEFENSKHA